MDEKELMEFYETLVENIGETNTKNFIYQSKIIFTSDEIKLKYLILDLTSSIHKRIF